MADLPEPDQEPGTAHPRDTHQFLGNLEAETVLADALRADRLHHAWLLTGPKGLGKATLAYRLARAALGAQRSGPRPLDTDPNDPVCRQIAAQAHPDLFVLRRGLAEKGQRHKRDIAAEDARALKGFFNLKAAQNGYRVAIVDAVDDLNGHAANALLKTLEEPPPRGLILLVCHRPAAALVTIRSRSRQLRLQRLTDAQMGALELAGTSEALVRLADGRPGRALALAQGEGPRFAAELLAGLERSRQGPSALLAGWPKSGADGWSQFDLAIEVLGDALRQASVATSLGHTPPGWAAAISPLACATAWSRLIALHADADRLDLDPVQAFALAAQVLDQTLSPSA